MPTNVLEIEELIQKDIFTNRGYYCGQIKDVELDLPRFRLKSIVVDAAKGSYLAQKVGGKKGVIIPYSMVSSIADVVIIKHFSASQEEDDGEAQEDEQKERVTEA